MYRDAVTSAKRIVIKIGSSSLTGTAGSQLDTASVEKIVNVIAALKERGAEVALVSSGAIAAGLAIASGLARVAVIAKTKFEGGGAGATGGGGGNFNGAGGGGGAAGITPDAISDIAANNSARLGIDPSLGSAAGAGAANNVMGGSSNSVVFSESSYSNFQDQVNFREQRSTIGGD